MQSKSTRARRSTGKRQRFEIFKRDLFTCQYCGAQPPSVVLVVDHVTPLADGGSNTIDNYLTACEACNQGKADIPLGLVVVRPDADLLYLATQQEIAELRRFQESQRELERERQLVIELVQDAWLQSSGLDWSPADSVLTELLHLYNAAIVLDAARDVAVKVGSGYISRHSTRWVGYLFAVARNMAQQQQDDIEEADAEDQ